MNDESWNQLFKIWSNFYYSQFLWFACTIFALIFGIKNYRKETSYTLFLIYCIFNLVGLNICNDLIFAFIELNRETRHVYIEIVNTVFAILETSTFFYLLKLTLKKNSIKYIINFSWFLFILLCLTFFIITINNKLPSKNIVQFSFTINYIEFFLLFPFCILYYYNLLTTETENSITLSKSPSFWIISGLFFYIVVSLPFLLIGGNVYQTDRTVHFILASIHYISISFLLICIAKGFSCKTTLAI
jgi:hypothetical protein